MPTKVLDDGVQVTQMLDDLFMRWEVEKLVVEVTGTNTSDVEAQVVEAVAINIGLGMDGINILNMVQQAFLIMEWLATIPKSMPEQSNLSLDDDGVEANNLKQPKAPTANQDDFSDEPNALHEACEFLYIGVQSTKLTTTMLLMNVC